MLELAPRGLETATLQMGAGMEQRMWRQEGTASALILRDKMAECNLNISLRV